MSKTGWNYFLEICSSADGHKILSEALDFFLTPEEKSSIEMRCLITKALLEQNITQRDMSEQLKVSIAKITRGSNELKRISPRLMRYLREQLCSDD